MIIRDHAPDRAVVQVWSFINLIHEMVPTAGLHSLPHRLSKWPDAHGAFEQLQRLVASVFTIQPRTSLIYAESCEDFSCYLFPNRAVDEVLGDRHFRMLDSMVWIALVPIILVCLLFSLTRLNSHAVFIWGISVGMVNLCNSMRENLFPPNNINNVYRCK